ncbi:MAG: MFS transporter [candidate division Zixibacteria bacterium]|nr:MFS transporter [candidate division Zixibacteria bacterium]
MSIYKRPNSIYSLTSISWGSYDLANTIFSMIVVTRFFPLWIIDDLGGTNLMVSITRSSAMLFIAISMPLLGGISDRIGKRKFFIFIFTILCCLFTTFLSGSFGLIPILVFFGVAVYCFQAALVFYNAMLPDVSPRSKEGKVSGMGVALGYVGAIAGMIIVRPFVGTGEAFSSQSAFLPAAILFFIFSIPLFIFVRERRILSTLEVKTFWERFKAPYRIFKSSSGFPTVRKFLIARFFIVEAMETIILFMAVFTKKVGGFDDKQISMAGMDEITLFLIVATIFAVVGSSFWGIAVDKIGAGKSLKICSLLWVITLLIAVVSPYKWSFWIIGVLAGICIGGIWTTDRAWLIQMIPEERRGEFFGLYALSGRLAAVIGPIIWGLTVKLAEPLGSIKYRFAVGAVFLMMLTGYFLIRRIPNGIVSEKICHE